MAATDRKKYARCLPGLVAADALGFDPALGALNLLLCEQGFTLQPTATRSQNARGVVTIRFVWRRRRKVSSALGVGSASARYEEVYRIG